MKVPPFVTLPVILVAAVVLGGAAYFVVSGALGSAAPASGVVSDTPLPVTDFSLTDQTGAPFTFSSTRGKVVVVAFLYTHCGDTCPFIAIKLREAWALLGNQADGVALVAVTTDAERDTVPVIAAYSRDLGLYDKWRFVTGEPQNLTAVYQALNVSVLKSEAEDGLDGDDADAHSATPDLEAGENPLNGLTEAQIADGGTLAQKYSGGYEIAHVTPFLVVDEAGQIRKSLDLSATPAQIAEAVKAYLD